VTSHLDSTLSALGDPTRRRMIDLLRQRPRRAGEFAESLGMTPPAISRHLRVLRTRGLIDAERGDDGRVRMIRLRRQPFDELGAWLGEVESYWTDQLAAFKAHAERTKKSRRP
jgi:DNA-binding transcriptional ArsR family regulator